MKHTVSDAELRRAISRISERADDATRRGDVAAAEDLGRAVREYQEQLARRP